MYLTILILPLLGSLVSGFLGRKLGINGSRILTTTCVVFTTLLTITVFTEVSLNHIPVSIHLFRWIDSESLMVNWSFNFDSLTVSMLIPVLIVSSLVHIYSIGYMSNDPHNQRFFSYLSLFTFMMIILVTGNNYLLMFVGWEGVGVCSYLLVSFWFTRIAANQSSLSAFLTNRVGDCFLTIGMFVLLLTFGNVNYSLIFSLSPYISQDIITLIGILLLLGAMAKSSQIGLHVWLPMAMEGPTPVSALIHAATMVTAGVYLLMRSSPLIEYSSTVLLLCLWIGAITTVFSSLIGLFQQDIKKVIAYSTMSQLGMMVIAVGLSSYNLALFHLVNHAFYKALLFLGAGSVIHAVADNQDFRKYGGLKAFLPLTYSVMLIASLSLVAFPFMTGFYSKDFILESAYGYFSFSTTSVYFIATIGAMFTTLYSVKVLYLTFLTSPNGPQASYKIAHEGDIYMSLPLIILAVFSIVFGYITKDLFIGLGSDVFSDNSIFIHPNHEIVLDTEFAVPVFFKLLPLVFTISLTVVYIIFAEFTSGHSNPIIAFKLSRFGYNFYSFFNQRFLIEAFYNKYITDFVLKIGGITTKVIDKGFIELIGPYGLEKGLSLLSSKIESLSTKHVTTYALYLLVGLMLFMVSFHGVSEYDSLSTMLLAPFVINRNFNILSRNSLSISKSRFSTSRVLFRMNPFNNTPNTFNNASDNDDLMDNSDSASESSEEDQVVRPANPSDGTLIDDTQQIAESCTTREQADEYFERKEQSMRTVLRNGTHPGTRQDHMNNMEFLSTQREDVYVSIELNALGTNDTQEENPNDVQEESPNVVQEENPNDTQEENPNNVQEESSNSNNNNESFTSSHSQQEGSTGAVNESVDETYYYQGVPVNPVGTTVITSADNPNYSYHTNYQIEEARAAMLAEQNSMRDTNTAQDTRLEASVEQSNSNNLASNETNEEVTSVTSNVERDTTVRSSKRKFEESLEEPEFNSNKKVKTEDTKDNGSNNGPDNGPNYGPGNASGPSSGGTSGGPSSGGTNGGISSGGTSGGSNTGANSGPSNNSNSRLLDDSFINKDIASNDHDTIISKNITLSRYVNIDIINTNTTIPSKETFIVKVLNIVLDMVDEFIWFF